MDYITTDRHELSCKLADKESRLTVLNAELNIDGDGSLEMQGDSDERDDDDFTEQVGRALDDMGVNYTRGYLPHSARMPQLAYAKAKPSILETVRSFDNVKPSGAQARDKKPEYHI